MIRFIATCCALLAAPVSAQEATSASGGVLRVLDKTTGVVRDIEMMNGDVRRFGLLTVELGECRYPTANPSGDAFQLMSIRYRSDVVFEGWMIASAPAISALQHPRYDVWALRCIIS